jgi:hypothetical protein
MKFVTVMKCCMTVLLFVTTLCYGQKWEAEINAGLTGYKGDLTENPFAVKTMRPGLGFNLKYNFDNTILLRGGILWGNLTGDDKYNKRADLRGRNLSFTTQFLEFSLVAEYNLLEPDIFFAYPYIFGGIGLFKFNSYAYDNTHKKTYLHALNTEGQGLAQYPDRKPYSTTQFCIPFGIGWKWRFQKQLEFVYEMGYRMIFTDYLDDVSKPYVDPQVLLAERGPKSVEMAFRAQYPVGKGDIRGNSDVNDWYYFHTVKLVIYLVKERKNG